MKDYMYLIYGGDEKWEQLSPEEIQQHMQKWGTWMQELKEKGHFLSGEPLENDAKSIRADKVVTDGPYSEAKELVGGYLLIKANSFDEAAELAKGCPIFDNDGAVEIRPVQEMNM